MAAPRILWYFADPMCSWCWGFAPVMSAVKDTYQHRLQLALVMGGLRPGTTEAVTPQFREETLQHWRDVQTRTGQAFKYDGALPDGFVYNTEPPCRAVVAVEDLKPEAKFAYFMSVQAAFYAEQQDVTLPETLAGLAEREDIAKERFLDRFYAADIQQRTQVHFEQTYRAGIRGFPAVVMQRGADFKLLNYGFAPLEELRPKIDAWLAEPDEDAPANDAP